MECRFCHNTIPDTAKYCSQCGKLQATQSKRHRRHRPQSQGTITKLSGHRTNPYWARLPVDYSSGVPIRESLGCYPTYAAAAEALSKALYTPEQLPRKETVVTLKSIYERFINSHYYEALSKSARGSHRTAWKYLSRCASVPISSINRDTFQVPIDEMYHTNLKRETLAKVQNLASLLCKEAMSIGLLNVNYGQLVQLPKADSEPATPFSSAQLIQIWATADTGDTDAMAVLILIYTGMRPGELLSTDIAVHLHMDGPYWYILHGSKTPAGRDRIIPLPMIIHDVITTLVHGRTCGPLIAASHGGFWRLDNWRPRRFNALMERLCLDGYEPYSCRHTYANLQKRKKVAPQTMMEIMGHTKYDVCVERYQSTTDEDIVRICLEADGFERPPTDDGI